MRDVIAGWLTGRTKAIVGGQVAGTQVQGSAGTAVVANHEGNPFEEASREQHRAHTGKRTSQRRKVKG